ncbi:MAG: tol-pal system YbgF family protein [Saprospiraceae bacterium]
MKSVFNNSKCLSRQQISDYLTGTADRATIHHIENHLLDCELCASAVGNFAQQTDIAATIQQTKHLDYSNRTPLRRWLRPLKAAASVAAVAAISFGMGWWIFARETPEQLFAQHFDTYENDITLSLRSGVQPKEYSTEVNPLTPALKAYDVRDFVQSIQLLTQRLQEQPNDVTAAYYLGLSYLESSELETAASYLETARINSERYYDAATWYLALTHLKLGKVNSTQLLLRELMQSKDTYYVNKAANLLAEL